jgi:undecaprenyl-diphosphatase
MTIVNYFILGIIQGIFEWLPISSEGVVALTANFLIRDINLVDAALFLHLGTLLAVIFYFRQELKEIILLKRPVLLKFLFIATPISLIVGYPLYKIIREASLLGSSLLFIIGLGLLATAYFQKKKKMVNVGMGKVALISGFLQGLAVIPGLSRSGATIFGLSLGGLKSEDILKFSYLMSIPVVLASSCYLFLENNSLILSAWPALISSALVGFFTLDILIKLAKRLNFFYFALIFAGLCFLGALLVFLI